MAVNPIIRNYGGKQCRCLRVTNQFNLYDRVKVILKNGGSVKGEIIFISEDEVKITEAYQPITDVKLIEIDTIAHWTPPEEW